MKRPIKQTPLLEQWGHGHNQNRQETIMSREDYNRISKATLQELLYLPAWLVIEWLEGQHQAVGEAVAKQCYQKITNS